MIVEIWRTSSETQNRYVKVDPDGSWQWIEVGTDRRWDIAGGSCADDDLPASVLSKAKRTRAAGVWPFWVEWPRG